MKLTEITKELFDYLVAFRRKVTRASAPSLDVVRHELELIFRTMEDRIAENPGKLAGEYQQVKYPLVVFADEVLLTSPWAHAKTWEQCLLEKKYFSSNIGGNQFFRLLAEVDRMPTGVITIFFYCLALGFRGGFAPNDPSLLRLKGRLVNRIMPAEQGDGKIMLADAYRIDCSGVGRLPSVWRWSQLAAGAVILFLVLLAIQRLVVWPLIIENSFEDLPPELNRNVDVAVSAPINESRPGISSGYTVQLGSFTSETVALHFARQIEQQGFPSKILFKSGPGSNQHYLVLTGQFVTREEAMQSMKTAESASTLVSEMSVISLEEVSGDCVHGCER